MPGELVEIKQHCGEKSRVKRYLGVHRRWRRKTRSRESRVNSEKISTGVVRGYQLVGGISQVSG